MNLAFTYNSRILAPAIVNGIAISSLYGVLVISLVLVHRINKSVAFVQGGIATVGGFRYGCPYQGMAQGARPHWCRPDRRDHRTCLRRDRDDPDGQLSPGHGHHLRS